LIWKAESDSSDNYLSSAAYKDGRLYVGTCKPGHKLFALDAQNGKVLWRVPVGRTTGQMFTSSPAISGKTVYLGAGPQSAGDDNGRVLALDAASGRSIWEYGTKDPVISSPAISNGMIYVGTLGGTLHAFAGNVETVKKAKTTHKRKH
jgi:outer membrane protein assembly factor BamB